MRAPGSPCWRPTGPDGRAAAARIIRQAPEQLKRRWGLTTSLFDSLGIQRQTDAIRAAGLERQGLAAEPQRFLRLASERLEPICPRNAVDNLPPGTPRQCH